MRRKVTPPGLPSWAHPHCLPRGPCTAPCEDTPRLGSQGRSLQNKLALEAAQQQGAHPAALLSPWGSQAADQGPRDLKGAGEPQLQAKKVAELVSAPTQWEHGLGGITESSWLQHLLHQSLLTGPLW